MNAATTQSQALDELAEEVRTRPTLVLDTSVLVADPHSIHAFDDSDLVIPLTVIEELDGLKSRQDQAGANARAVVRLLEEHRTDNGGSLTTAVDLDRGCTLRVEPNGLRIEELDRFHLPADKADHRILAAALGLAGDGRRTVVVSCDGAMRLKADTLGLEATDYLVQNAPFTTRDVPGWHQVEVTGELIDALHAAKHVALDALSDHDTAALDGVEVNEFVVAKAGRSSALARRTGTGLRLLPPASKTRSWGIQSRNKEQQFALDLLTDAAIEVVALSGRAGTGKTLVAIAAALEQTFEADARYDRVMVLRPMFAIGKQDLGFLPGDVEDKVAPWFDAIVDAMVALSTTGVDHKAARDQLTQWVEQGKFAMEPVTFLRGRSLGSTLLIVDEVQNLEQAEVKTILTRLGDGSKIVVCGDPDQCDNPFTSPTANGLTSLVAAFRGQEVFGHVELTACERSRVADLAADLL